ncbi:MAG: hypothetical protein ACJA0V_001744 [Planctomycetota bacterium]
MDGRTLTGTLAVAEDGIATITGEAGETKIDVGELLSFERADAKPRKVQVENRVWLRSGLELPAKKLSGRVAADGQPAILIVRLPAGLNVEVPLSTVRAIRQGGLQRPQPNLFPQDLEAPPANNDLIYVVKDGKAQRSSVTVASITAKSIEFGLRGSAYDFELSGIAAVVFGANTGFAPDRQPRPRAAISLTTGERIEGKILSLGESLRCRIDEGFVIDVPMRNLHRIDVSSDKLVWMSELTPKVEQTPAFDRVWPWHTDRSIAGPGFDLAGTHFERGLGLVPYTKLTYDLSGRFDMFEAMIGIDDRGGPEAHAIFRVLADGKQVFESKPMTRGQRPLALRIDLNKAKALVLEVDFGKNYDLGDFCAFADARVVQR